MKIGEPIIYQFANGESIDGKSLVIQSAVEGTMAVGSARVFAKGEELIKRHPSIYSPPRDGIDLQEDSMVVLAGLSFYCEPLRFNANNLVPRFAAESIVEEVELSPDIRQKLVRLMFYETIGAEITPSR